MKFLNYVKNKIKIIIEKKKQKHKIQKKSLNFMI